MYVIIFSLIVLIPSFFIMRGVIKEITIKKKIESFVMNEFGQDRKYLEDYLVIETDTLNELILKIYGSSESKASKKRYEDSLAVRGLQDWRVTILPTSEVNLARVAQLETQIGNNGKMVAHMDSLQNIKTEQELNIQKLKNELRSTMLDSTFFKEVCLQTKVKFPDLSEIAIGILPNQDFGTNSTLNKDIVIVRWSEEVNPKSIEIEEAKLKLYLEGRLNKDTIILFREQQSIK